MSVAPIELDPAAIAPSVPEIGSCVSSDEAPLRFVRFGDAQIPVAQNEHRAAALVVRAALHMVQYWGIVSVDAVVERARALGPNLGADEALVSRVLGAAPGTQWLDWPARRWFSFAGSNSQLEITVRKVLAIATSIRIEDLRNGLAKAVPAIAEAPSSVLQQYLRQIVGCRIDGMMIEAADGVAIDRTLLSAAEASLVRILEAAGGTSELTALRRGTRAAGLAEATTRRALKMSPLFLPASAGAIRLIGHGLGRRSLVQSTRDQRQEMTEVPGMMSGGHVPISRLQVKRSTQ